MLHLSPKQLIEAFYHYKTQMTLVCAIPTQSLIHLSNDKLFCSTLTKEEFEAIKMSITNQFIVVYCASYSCSAGENYAKSLKLNDCIVAEYKGGLHEWALLSLASKMYKMVDVTDKTQILSSETIIQYLSRSKDNSKVNDENAPIISGHWYHETRKLPLFTKLKQEISLKKEGVDMTLIDTECEYCTTHDHSLQGKRVVVTGGTRGLGLQIAMMAAAVGAKHVTITSRNKTKEEAEKNNSVSGDEVVNALNHYAVQILGRQPCFTYIQKDASKKDDNDDTFNPEKRREELNLKELQYIDCAVFNAGIFGIAGNDRKIPNLHQDIYQNVINTNQNGVFYGMQAFSKYALEAQKENDSMMFSAVVIASIYASSASVFSNVAYQASKAAALQIARQAGIELARNNVRVNSVSPTFLDTNMTRQFHGNEMIRQGIANHTPTGTWGKKTTVASTVTFLLSNASHSITAKDVPVDCGVLSESVPNYVLNSQMEEEASKNKIEGYMCCGSEK